MSSVYSTCSLAQSNKTVIKVFIIPKLCVLMYKYGFISDLVSYRVVYVLKTGTTSLKDAMLLLCILSFLSHLIRECVGVASEVCIGRKLCHMIYEVLDNLSMTLERTNSEL